MTALRSDAPELRWYFYQDPSGEWRWDAVAADGAVVAQSLTAFATRPQSVQDARLNGHAADLPHTMAASARRGE